MITNKSKYFLNQDNDNQRIRILIITDTCLDAIGGSEQFLRRLVTGLSAEHYQIDVIQLSGSQQPSRELSEHSINLEAVSIDAVYASAARSLWRKLRRKVLAGTWDIVHSQHEKSDIICALLPHSNNSPTWISSRRDSGFQRSVAVSAAFRFLNHRFDCLVAPSQAILDDLVKHGGVQKSHLQYIPNGVAMNRFTILKNDTRTAERAKLALEPNDFVFGCVARMVPVKRHHDLIEAFTRLASHKAEARLVLIGDGPLEAELRSLALQAGIGSRVRFMGARDDVDKLLPLLDAFVLCSATEGMSNSLLEGMAAGLPIIATEVGGNPEVVPDGKAGVLVAPARPDRLAVAMEKIASEPKLARAMGRRARAHVRSNFSEDAMIEAWDRLYQKFARNTAQS